jgi:hypothetical protein
VLTRRLNCRGKFYRDGNKGVEIKPQALDGTTIEDDQTVPVYSCGRDGAASGTEGSFELHDQKTQKRVCTIEWDCPWGSHTNTFDIKNINDQFRVVHGPYNKSGGALGTVDISVNPAGHGHH